MSITDHFPDFHEIGYTKKAFGVNGRLKYYSEDKYKNSIVSAKHCFFLMKGCMVPYFIDVPERELEEGVIKFESTKNPETAKTLVSKTIYLRNDQIKEDTSIQVVLAFDFIKGMDIYNADSEQLIGLVSDVVEYPEQEIAIVIDNEGREIMIPINEHNFKGIEEEKRAVFVEIPEGLLDIYIN